MNLNPGFDLAHEYNNIMLSVGIGVILSIMSPLFRAALFVVLFFYLPSNSFSKTLKITSFNEAKKILPALFSSQPLTLYCGCKFLGKTIDLKSCGYKVQKNMKRAARLEWEHVVPAHAFGQSFKEWREGAPKCVKHGKHFKGRKCAAMNPVFAAMEGNLYNLWPEIGELNGLRSNYSFAELGAAKGKKFGECKVLIQNKKFEPEDNAKGRVARIYLYMEATYPGHGIISNKNQNLFAAWDASHPVDPFECSHARDIEAKTGMQNEILKARCKN